IGGEHPGLFAEFARRFESANAPDGGTSNNWLEVRADLACLLDGVVTNSPWGLPALSLSLAGRDNEVHTRAQFTFPKPLPASLESWNVPTNLIHDPLISFTAMRGVQPWISSLKAWNDLKFGAAPDQVFIWEQEGVPQL